jgi:transposase
MRGEAEEPEAIFSYITPSQRVPPDHPLRGIRKVVDAALEKMSPRFQRLYARTGRPSIPPERLIRALLLQVLYTIRSERQLIEHLNFNILYRWFVGLGLDDRVWDATSFTKNRDRLLYGEVDKVFFDQVLAEAAGRGLLSTEHFTVDGTLVEAWAGLKSFKRKDGSDQQQPPDDPGNPTVNFHGEKRSNDTHQSTTDPDARLMTKGGQEAKLYFMGHVVMENRHGLAVGGQVPAHAAARRLRIRQLVAARSGAEPHARHCRHSSWHGRGFQADVGRRLQRAPRQANRLRHGSVATEADILGTPWMTF